MNAKSFNLKEPPDIVHGHDENGAKPVDEASLQV
jgi:hypothetical protein